MLYKLNDNEMRQIAEVYEMDVELLMEKINFQDDVVSFLPRERGIEIKTENTESLILRFKQ